VNDLSYPTRLAQGLYCALVQLADP
jgi:hypothetical protein